MLLPQGLQSLKFPTLAARFQGTAHLQLEG
jgi:hypothetical protein